MGTKQRPLAVVTGASTGIGYHLALLCAQRGFDLVVAADQVKIATAATEFARYGTHVEPMQVDLSRESGVDALCTRLGPRPVDALLANAGIGLGHAFLDQRVADFLKVIDTNITGTLLLVHRVGNQMRAMQRGRILITGSIAGLMPGSFQAVYNGTKAFLDSFAAALRNELDGSGVSVTCLLPGATETEFFARADMLDTKVGQAEKDDPAEVAKTGFDAMMKGEGSVVHGLKNKVQAAVAGVVPESVLAAMHRSKAAPGTAKS